MLNNDPYSTHLPVLKALAQEIRIECVLEFGCGVYSTPAFLDKEYFPDLGALVSIESDEVWRDRMQERIHDPRWAVYPDTVYIKYDAYDLIFIDDGHSAGERVDTIYRVMWDPPEKAIVVIHDFENEEYQKVGWLLFKYTGLRPSDAPHSDFMARGASDYRESMGEAYR